MLGEMILTSKTTHSKATVNARTLPFIYLRIYSKETGYKIRKETFQLRRRLAPNALQRHIDHFLGLEKIPFEAITQIREVCHVS